jgi:hypothetical protein
MYRCARCHRPMLVAVLQVEEDKQLLSYGRRCAEALGLLIPQPRRRNFHRRPRRDVRQLPLEARP